MAFKPFKPTHKIRIRPRQGGVSAIAGRAWWNPEKNQLSIQLNTGISLSWNDDIYIIAVPMDQKDEEDSKDIPVGSG